MTKISVCLTPYLRKSNSDFWVSSGCGGGGMGGGWEGGGKRSKNDP